MAFHLSAEREASEYLTSNPWDRYLEYLEQHRSNIPRTAHTLASSPWWYSFADPKAPHDAHLERFEVVELPDPQRENGVLCSLRIQLRSAYSGSIKLHYPKVYAYRMSMLSGEFWSHGEWRYDEITSDGTPGRFIHTIEWTTGATWEITAGDIYHEYER